MTDSDNQRGRHAATSAVDRSGTFDLLGRAFELDAVLALIDRLRSGVGGALVVRGEAGIGKSSLLTQATRDATSRGLRVLSAIGVQSEAQLPFAALHQLVAPILGRGEALPTRQRAALLAAFGMSEAIAPEIFLVGLATLDLLDDAAEDAPLLLIVDDAHWLDDPSGAVLSFVARRLEASPVVMLIATRDSHRSPIDENSLPQIRLEGLDDVAACKLLDARSPGLDVVLRRRLLDEAAGNPLALVELPIAWKHDTPIDGIMLPPHLPMSARLERAFAESAAHLPAATRSLLLIAAADDSSVLGEILSATSILEGSIVTADTLSPAIDTRLVTIHGTGVGFRHPLIRSAIYQAATVTQRQAAHAALGEVLIAQPERRVWHRAAASLGPDDHLAVELDEAAVSAARRGAASVAIAAYERAAELSEEPTGRASRLLRAAEVAFESGHTARALDLQRAAESLTLSAADRRLLSWLREVHDDARWPGAMSAETVGAVTEQMEVDGHGDLAWKFLLKIALGCWWRNPDQAMRDAVVAAAASMPIATNEPVRLAVLAHADPVGQAASVIRQISRMTPDSADPAGMYLVGAAASAAWAYDVASIFLDSAVDGLRAQGRVNLLAQALTAQAWAAVHLAREPLAVSAAEEAILLTRETAQPSWTASAQLAQATIAAERGDLETAEALAGEAEALLVPMGATSMLALVQFVRGRGAVAHQRYDEGFEHLRRTLDRADLAYHPFIGAWGLSDLIEASAHTNRKDAAIAYLEELESLAAATSGSLLRAAAGYARPFVADRANVEVLYQSAIEIDLANWPCYRGRMLLWYGRWLRRQRRVTESRTPLRNARQAFDALAFPLLAATARDELRASGETSGRRNPEAWNALTPQELQIARLASDGFTNREIGEKLYISHRTVGYHLHRTFPKLGITSRSQLHAAVLSLGSSA